MHYALQVAEEALTSFCMQASRPETCATQCTLLCTCTAA